MQEFISRLGISLFHSPSRPTRGNQAVRPTPLGRRPRPSYSGSRVYLGCRTWDLVCFAALTWDLVCFAVPSSQVEMVWKAVQARHRQFQLLPPLFEVNQYSAWVWMLGSVRGRPTSLKLPIQKATIRWLLAWRPATMAGHRARLLTCVATLACMRVNEVCRLQVCDLWFDYLTSYGVPGFEGTCSVHIDRRISASPHSAFHASARIVPFARPRSRTHVAHASQPRSARSPLARPSSWRRRR